MATPRRRQAASLIDALFGAPQRFEFFRAMQLLGRIAAGRRRRDDGARAGAAPDEPVRLSASPTLSFPLAEIEELRSGEGETVAEMQIAFMGLNGSSGVLPRHYSELAQRQARQKSFALRNFFDIFTHRAATMHFLAWRKYRLAEAIEASANAGDDAITASLYALIGFGTPGLRDRLAVEDDTLIHYGGLFAQATRSAIGLELLLSDYLARPVEVIPFVGRWAPLLPEDWTSLATRTRPFGNYAQLGVDAVAGTRVWDVQGGFRLRLGPLAYRQFAELMPNSPLMNEVAALTRTYVGPGLAFDVELVLRGDAVPLCTLAPSGDFLPRLGWNTWLHAPSRPAIVADAVMRFTKV
jgi:type VI secretion system protein ImpH